MHGSQLTDDDVIYGDGKEDELIGRSQKRTGDTRENIDRAVCESGNC